MIKIEKVAENINPFGGINFVVQAFRDAKIDELIDNELGARCPQARYSYSDILIAIWLVFYCGGECAEDLNEHLRPFLGKIPDLQLPDADSILGVMKKLATEKDIHFNNGTLHEYNDNEKFNQLLVRSLLHTKLLMPGVYYDLDFDHQLIGTEKFDSKKSYKNKKGYFPGIAIIDGLPVYIENRNGNSNVKYLQEKTLEKVYGMLSRHGVKIGRSRMDCGSYKKEVVEVVEKHSRYFYIRAMKCEAMRKEILAISEWEEVEINNINYEVASVDYAPFGGEKSYRLVIMRTKENQGQGNLFTGDARIYRSILTNDRKSKEKEIVEFYNHRGASEKVFDVMNNDFGWGRLPFSFMNENTVFLLAMAIGRCLFQWLICKVSLVFKHLKPNHRIKRFIFGFVTVCCKWVKGGGGHKLKVFSDKPYEKIARIDWAN